MVDEWADARCSQSISDMHIIVPLGGGKVANMGANPQGYFLTLFGFRRAILYYNKYRISPSPLSLPEQGPGP